MAMPVTNFDDFERKFERNRRHAKVFAFFLFDDRPSHQVIESFASEQWDWLDAQASAAKMFFYFFLRPNRGANGYINPSNQVAATFGITASELPGIVVFAWDDVTGKATGGVYFPLNASIFSGDISVAEKAIADFFSLVQEHQSDSLTGPQIVQNIETQVEHDRRAGRFRALFSYLGGALKPLVSLPEFLAEATAKAFAEAIVKQTRIG